MTQRAALASFASVSGGTIVDGVTYAAGDRVLPRSARPRAPRTASTSSGPWAAESRTLTRPTRLGDRQVLAGMLVEVAGVHGRRHRVEVATDGANHGRHHVALDPLPRDGPGVELSAYKARSVVTANVGTLSAFAGVTGGTSVGATASSRSRPTWCS